MDTGRRLNHRPAGRGALSLLLVAVLAGPSLGGCAHLRARVQALAADAPAAAPAGLRAGALPGALPGAFPGALPPADPVSGAGGANAAPGLAPPPASRPAARMDPIPDPPPRGDAPTPVAREIRGEAAVAAANRAARAPARLSGFTGAVQVFPDDPAQVYEVRTAPLRVTTLTLPPGETVTAKAAGDTVRWQIGETRSGRGAAERTHVMIKPLERGLETNLVLATSRRLYLLQLRSGDPASFNAVVAWDVGPAQIPADPPAGPDLAAAQRPPADPGAPNPAANSPSAADPDPPFDAGYRIIPRGRRPAWTPTAAMTDGRRTLVVLPAALAGREAPAFFLREPDGALQLANYRQQGGVLTIDRVVEAAELRLGAETVRIERRRAAP